MAKRLIEIVLPKGRANDIPELLYEQSFDGYWVSDSNDNQACIRILLASNEVEAVFDILDTYLEQLPGTSAILLHVEAVIPRIKTGLNDSKKDEPDEENNKSIRISRHELYNDIVSAVGINGSYLAMTLLSVIVAAIGLLRNDMAIIIGAMVIAPLLLPNVAMALASALGDTDLSILGGKSLITGFLLALSTSILIGFFIPVDATIDAISARTNIQLSDLVLAMASGAAAVLAFTSGGQLSLIGVMVAVALMPPLVTGGLLIGSGDPVLGIKALELTSVNVICVNLAGILTFMSQGIRPATWWEKSKASSARKRAIWGWLLPLVILFYILLK